MKRNILLCLEKMGIGGVETYVLNSALAMKAKGYNVFVMAEKGIYTDLLIENGIKFINMPFLIESNFNLNKAKEISKILKEYSINEVHINQYTGLTSIFPACVELNIPYVVYIHSIIFDVFEWFEAKHKIYRDWFKAFFALAQQIVFISDDIKDLHIKKYKISSKNYVRINNGINFDLYKSQNIVKKIKTFALITRFSSEKYNSINNSINFFINYNKKIKDSKLLIFGDGPDKKRILKLIKNLPNIFYMGLTNDIVLATKGADAILGVDRVIIEGLALKKLCFVSGYTGFKGIVDSSNILKLSEENFSGNNYNNISIDKIINLTINLTPKRIKEIIEYNYSFVNKNNNINSNLIFIGNQTKTYPAQLYSKIIKYQHFLAKRKLIYYLDSFIKRVLFKIKRIKKTFN